MAVTKSSSQCYLKIQQASARTPWRCRFKKKVIPRTPAERAAMKAKNHTCKQEYAEALGVAQETIMHEAVKLRERFGCHSIEYYYEAIMQKSQLTDRKKGPNRWNAFLCAEVRKHNDALPPDQPRAKATELQARLASVWNQMTPEAKLDATEEAMEDLKEHRLNKSIAISNLSNLTARTGQKCLLMAVQGDLEHLQCPFIYVSDETVADYFHTLTQMTVAHFAARLEACSIAGVTGLINNYKESFLTLKKETAQLILQKLNEAARIPVPKMFYSSFDTCITQKCGVVVVNWPLKKFQSPSDIGSMTELRLLHASLKNGTTTFHKMSQQEWEEWENKRSDKQPAVGDDGDEGEGMDVTGSGTTSQSSSNKQAASSSAPPPTPSAPVQSVTFSVSTGQSTNPASGAGAHVVMAPKKTRKTQSDKGTKRGPRYSTH
ncbi:hypothetical protein BU15DRAFT_72552 [Melanogaster broomeanus]|nr:hypothetical protein BU15DRAFT_72552 [Melanogaster broomeanus]